MSKKGHFDFFNTDDAQFHFTQEGERISVIIYPERHPGYPPLFARIYFMHETDYTSICMETDVQELRDGIDADFAGEGQNWILEADEEGMAVAKEFGFDLILQPEKESA